MIALLLLAGTPVRAETSLNVATPQPADSEKLNQPAKQADPNQPPENLSKRNREKLKVTDEAKKRRKDIAEKKAAEAVQK